MTYQDRFQKALTAGQVKDIVPDMIEWKEPNQVVYGELIEIDTATSNDRDFNCYTFQGDEKLFRITLGIKYDRLVTEQLIGMLLRIEYLGKHTLKNGNTANEFDIRVADDSPKVDYRSKNRAQK